MFPHPTSRKIARLQAFSRKLLLMRLTPAWELPSSPKQILHESAARCYHRSQSSLRSEETHGRRAEMFLARGGAGAGAGMRPGRSGVAMGGGLAGGDAQASRRLDRGAGKADRRNRKADRGGGGERRLICLFAAGLGSAGAPCETPANPQTPEMAPLAWRPGEGVSERLRTRCRPGGREKLQFLAPKPLKSPARIQFCTA